MSSPVLIKNCDLSHIECSNVSGSASRLQVGNDVIVECEELVIGDNVRIGAADKKSFRFPGGVRIKARRLVLGDGVTIERQVSIEGGDIELGRNVKVAANSSINVKKRLVIGAHGIMNDSCEIAGVDVEIGRELWMLPFAKIGGGSCFEVQSRFRGGNWLHIGTRSFLNTARPVTIGDEVGLGTATSLYTHGAYPSALDGKPVAFGPISIGDRTWLPGAIVNPNVTIGSDCVIGVGSVVTRNIPDGSLAAGIPAAILKEKAYPKPLSPERRYGFFADFLKTFADICSDTHATSFSDASDALTAKIGDTLVCYLPVADAKRVDSLKGPSACILLTDSAAGTVSDPLITLVDCVAKRVSGPANALTERLFNQLRRYGIRFNFEAIQGTYVGW